MPTPVESTVDQIVAALRDGPCTFRMLLVRLQQADDRVLDRALQKARRDGLIEYSNAEGDKRKLWRLVARMPKCSTHQQVKSALDETHAQGFADGQDHAFQIVADKLRKIAVAPTNGMTRHDLLTSLAIEIESGAWAEEED